MGPILFKQSPSIRSVDGKIIRRSLVMGPDCAARVRHQHMGLLKSEKRRKRSNNMDAKFAARIPGIGNTAGGLLAAAAHWLCRGLRIATGARPPRLTRGAAGVSLWGCPRSWQGGPPGPLGGRVKSLGAKSPSHVPAHPPVLLAGAGTYLPCWV